MSDPFLENQSLGDDEEMSVFAFVETVWREKWMLLLFCVLSALAAVAYTSTREVKILYDARIQYRLNFSTLEEFESVLGEKLVVEQHPNALVFLSHRENDFNRLLEKLEAANKKLTADLSQEKLDIEASRIESAENTLRMLGDISSDSLISSDAFSELYLGAKVDILDAEQKMERIRESKKYALTFIEPIKVSQSAGDRKASFVLALSTIGGGLMGLLFIFGRRSFVQYKLRKSGVVS